MSDLQLKRNREQLQRKLGKSPTLEIAAVNGNMFTPDGRLYVREPGGIEVGGIKIKNPAYPMRYRTGVNLFIGEGRKVWTRTAPDGKMEIDGNDPEDLRQVGINPRQLNANDPSARYKDLSLISDLQTFPTGDGTVMVHPGVYRKTDGTYANFSGAQEIDLLTSYKPATADNQQIVALWIDEDTNTIAVTTSSELSQATDLKINIPTAMTYLNQTVTSAPARRVGIGTYIIKGGDTTIDETNKFKGTRGILQAFSQSGNVGYPNPVTYDFQIPAGNTLLVEAGWTISAGGTVTVNAGSVVRMI